MASNEINLNEISSGEKKIIFLLAVAYLMDDITVLIDEPEPVIIYCLAEDDNGRLYEGQSEEYYNSNTFSIFGFFRRTTGKYCLLTRGKRMITLGDSLKNIFQDAISCQEPSGLVMEFNVYRTDPRFQLFCFCRSGR